ncbi:DUF229 domain-containing protein [Halorubrum sp. SS5]|nr:DUF229 domain-containing protein [Halorubrum sp. SS5]
MNAIVFVFDSLRADHVSTYGHHRKTTPNIDEVAADGVVFENTFSQAIWTTPSSGSILTGCYPENHGRLAWGDRIADEAETIATPFQREDVHTCAISTMATVSDQGGYDEGFDEFIDLSEVESPTDPRAPEVVINRVVEWLEANADQDFFLFIWSSGTHTPYQTPSYDAFVDSQDQDLGSILSLKEADANQSQEVRDLYDNAIRYNDEHFGRMINTLQELGVYDETLLALLSDHGELFDEHARLEHAEGITGQLLETALPAGIRESRRLFTPQGWLGHQAVLPYDELLHVPMILKLPSQAHAGKRIDALAQNIDLGPTIVDVLLDTEWKRSQGRSLLPTLEGQAVNKYVYSTSSVIGGNVRYHSVRDETHKYVRLTNTELSLQNLRRFPKRALGSQLLRLVNGSEKLFEVQTGEEENILGDDETVDTRFREAFVNWHRTNDTRSSISSQEIDEEAEDRLRELGYLE